MRDKSRSLLPIIVISIGVFTIVFMDAFVAGMMDNMVRMTANYQTGHLKVVSRAYWDDKEMQPVDLSLMGAERLVSKLEQQYPALNWIERIPFGGLIDLPTSEGEAQRQGPVAATAYNFLAPRAGQDEAQRLGLAKALTAGRLITQPREVIISIDFAEQYHVKPGDEVTFFGSTMYGSMAFGNYRVAGVMRFGSAALDRGALMMDIADARLLLDMDDAVSEVLGFYPNHHYDIAEADRLCASFNADYVDDPDEYAPVMYSLADQNAMREMLSYIDIITFAMMIILLVSLSVVLWNTGIISGIRRYNEFGLRLAMGEEKGAIYRTLLLESLIIGLIGSIVGTVVGISFSYYFEVYGLDYSEIIKNSSMMVDPIIRAKVTWRLFYIGYIPGVFSMLIGSALAGRAIYKRQTATLFKELD